MDSKMPKVCVCCKDFTVLFCTYQGLLSAAQSGRLEEKRHLQMASCHANEQV